MCEQSVLFASPVALCVICVIVKTNKSMSLPYNCSVSRGSISAFALYKLLGEEKKSR